MREKDITTLMDELLDPIGFKKKGSHWMLDNAAIIKIVIVQKSQFSNSFCINYGYIIKSIPLNQLIIHVVNELGSFDRNQNRRIRELLDLENDIPSEERSMELKQFIMDHLMINILAVNTEEDILHELMQRPHLNDIPLVVKEHFGLLD